MEQQRSMFINSGTLLHLAHAAAERCKQVHPRGYTPDAITAVVMAAAATEAFINEIVAMADVVFGATDGIAPGAAVINNLAKLGEEIETNKGTIKLKYLIAALALSGKVFDTGSQPYQDFSLLVSLRNEIMHLSNHGATKEGGLQRSPPGAVKVLSNRKLTTDSIEDNLVGWFVTIQTSKVAEWAYNSAKRIIEHVVNMVPAESGMRLTAKMVFTDEFYPLHRGGDHIIRTTFRKSDESTSADTTEEQ